MSETPPARATWFKFYGQRYLMGGSLRAECLPDERSVWTDFMCLANAGDGHFDCANKDALAIQLLIPRELLDRSIKKFIEAGRLAVQYNKREHKETFTLVKWAYYQAPPRSHKKGGGPEGADAGADDSPPQTPPHKKERKKDIKRERERRGSNRAPQIPPRGSNRGAGNSPFSGETEISKNGEKPLSKLNTPPSFSKLPEIPKDLAFQVKDKLREMKAKILELERLILDERGRQMAGFTEAELKAKIERLRREFVHAIEDRS